MILYYMIRYYFLVILYIIYIVNGYDADIIVYCVNGYDVLDVIVMLLVLQ